MFEQLKVSLPGYSGRLSDALDLDPNHRLAESAEPPTFSLHAYTGKGIVSHIVPVGSHAVRKLIEVHAPDFVRWVTTEQADRNSLFS